MNTAILTHSGVLWNLLDPKAENVRLNDLLIPMSRIVRFNGHTATPINLLQHSKLVFDLVGLRAKPYALLHDAHEAYIGDIATPVANAWGHRLDDLEGKLSWLSRIKYEHDKAIWRAFGLELEYGTSDDIANEIEHADRMALAIEKNDFPHIAPEGTWTGLPKALPLAVESVAISEFRSLLKTWCPRVPE